MATGKKNAQEWLDMALKLEAEGKVTLAEKAFEKAVQKEIEENSSK